MSSPSNPSPIVRARHRRTAWKIIAWTGGSIVALLLFIVATIAILLNNRRFHDYLQRYAEQQASDTLGVRVQLQNFALNLAHLDLDVYGLSIDGAAPYANPPLLQVDHVEVGVRVVSFLQRKWYLDTVRVDRPIVHLFVDANGNSNLPKLQSSGKGEGNNTDIFDLAIRQALVDRGEVYYNDRKSALAADMHDLDFQAAFNPQLQQYSGRIQYSNGHLVSGTLHTIPHSLDARFDATRTTFHLNQAALSTGPSQLILNATVQNYANPLVDARYDASLDGAQIGQLLDNPSVPTGQLRATGSVHYQQADGRSALDSLIVNGDLSSRQLNLRSASLRTQLNNLEGHYSLANSTATLHDLRMNLLGGQLIAAGEMANIGGDSHSKVNADLRSISLADLSRLSGSASSRTVAVSGALNAKLDASWGKTIQDLVAHADATINGNVARPVATAKVSAATVDKASATAAASIPIDGVIHATYTGNGQQIALKDSYIRTPQTSITMNGTVSKQSSLALRLQADDLREIETVADTFRTPAPALGLAGTASFEGTVTGSTTAPHLAGQLTASNLQVSGTSWKSLRTSVELSPSLISLQHGELNAASRGRITFGGSAELAKWSFTGNTPLQLQLNVSQIDVAEFTKFSPQPVPVTGTVTANIAIHGSELNPVGNGTVSLANLVAYDQPITSAKVTFSGTGSDAQAQLAVQLPSGNIQGNVSVKPQQKTYTAQVTVTGVQLQKLQALSVRNIDATGELSLKASGQGSFDNPQFYADLQIPQLVVQHQSITGLNLQLNVANHVGNADLSTSAVNTHIQAKAQVQLTGDYLADATIDTQAIPFAPLIAVYAPEQAGSVTGQTELHATLHGPLKNKHLLEAHLTIPTLKVAYGSKIQLAAANPIHMDYKNGVVELQRASIVGTDTNLQLQGSIPVDAPNAPMSVMLLGSVDLQLAQLFDPDIQTSGQIKLNVNSSGPANSSNIGGEVQIVDASYSSADLPVGLQHANGVLTVSRDRIDISKFQGRVGGGTLTARGGVTLQPQIQFDVGLTADGIRMLYPQGLRESVNANVRLAGNTDSATLGGSINLSDLSFTSAFDLDSFIGQFGGVSTPPTPGFSQNLQLNLALHSTNDIALASRTLSVNGSANLQVRGTAAKPVILGRVNLNGGDIILNGDRFLLNGGTIQFVNPYETEPVVNLSLKTTIQQYDIYLRFNGPIEQLHTNYNSDPSLPTADIINLLAFGQTTEANAANAATPTDQAAESLVASQVSSQVTSRISKIAGISQLSINPVLGSGANQVQGANITIQQRVTSNLFVTFTSNSTQTQIIQGQYQLSPRVAISVTRDQNGGIAGDALIKKTW